MNDQVLIEVCVDSVESALAAERGGAGRIELCSNLLEGGITPSAGLIETVRARISIPIQVMIRPRSGDFYYSEEEIRVMRHDIATAKNLKANGIVFGILTPTGQVDVDRARQLVDSSRPLAVTFHRAFDMTNDLFRALEDVYATGAHRILTSGGEQTSLQGIETIAALVKSADDRIAIIAGAGINPDSAPTLVARTGVREVHVGLSSSLPSPMLHQNPRVSMGKMPGREYLRSQVREEDVRALRHAINHLRK